MDIPSELIGPLITGIFGISITIVAAVMARRGKRYDNRETRAPDVQEMWVQQERDRATRQHVEDLWWGVRRAFQSYFQRVTLEIIRMKLPESEQKKFELTASELRAIEATVPEDD